MLTLQDTGRVPILSSAHSFTRPEVKQRTQTCTASCWDCFMSIVQWQRKRLCMLVIAKIIWMEQWPASTMVEPSGIGLWRLHICGHLQHHPIIKVPSKPQTPLPFLFPLMWRFIHFTARTLLLTFILGQTLRTGQFVCLKTPCINHIKSPGDKGRGWQHQTNIPISHCTLFLVYHIADEGGVVYSGISHCKGKETHRLAHSISTETSGLLCSQLQ